MINLDARHPATRQIAAYFTRVLVSDEAELEEIRLWCADLSVAMIQRLPDGPELTAGLRKLLEAKDCFVRAALPEKRTTP
jgi:hypothetical protein